jgi:protein SCO1/2
MAEAKSSNRIFKILILAVILILPGFLYYLLEREGKNSYKPLPVYGEKTLTGTHTRKMGDLIPDTAFHHVPISYLLNQRGELQEFPIQDTSISVVNFMYTRCETFCKHLNDEMNRVATRFQNNHKVHFYTVTVDPEFDTPSVLSEFSAPYSPVDKKWYWLTNQPESTSADSLGTQASWDVHTIARAGYLVDAYKDTTREAHFIHSSMLILVDSDRKIRGYYDVNHKKEVDRLIDEVKLLLVEEVRKYSPY